MIIEYHGAALLKDKKLLKAIKKTLSPRIAKEFIKLGVEFKNKDKFLQIAINQNAPDLIEFYTQEEPPLKTTQELPIIVQVNSEELMGEHYGKGISQKEYKAFFQEITAIVHTAIQNNEFSLLLDKKQKDPNVYSFFKEVEETHSSLNLIWLGKVRQFIAKISGTEEYKAFGVNRTNSLSIPLLPSKWANTPLLDRYAPYFTDFLNLLVPEEYQGEGLSYTDYWIKKGEVGIRALIHETLEGNKINLTIMGFAISNIVTYPCLIHTDKAYINKILKHTNILFKKLISSSINLDEPTELNSLIEDVSEIHWWLAQAVPYVRGSAWGGEVIISALFQYYHLSVEWSVQPDAKALLAPIEYFVKNYQTFSTIKPLPYAIPEIVHEVELNKSPQYS
jgi:hypothetical protein